MKEIFKLITFLLLNNIVFGQISVMPIVSGSVVVGGVQNGKWLSAKWKFGLMRGIAREIRI